MRLDAFLFLFDLSLCRNTISRCPSTRSRTVLTLAMLNGVVVLDDVGVRWLGHGESIGETWRTGEQRHAKSRLGKMSSFLTRRNRVKKEGESKD